MTWTVKEKYKGVIKHGLNKLPKDLKNEFEKQHPEFINKYFDKK